MTVNLSWASIGALVAALAGIAGTIITPIYGTGLADSVTNVLQALSALLIAIPTFHVSSVAAANAKAKAQMKLDVEREARFYRIHQGLELEQATPQHAAA